MVAGYRISLTRAGVWGVLVLRSCMEALLTAPDSNTQTHPHMCSTGAVYGRCSITLWATACWARSRAWLSGSRWCCCCGCRGPRWQPRSGRLAEALNGKRLRLPLAWPRQLQAACCCSGRRPPAAAAAALYQHPGLKKQDLIMHPPGCATTTFAVSAAACYSLRLLPLRSCSPFLPAAPVYTRDLRRLTKTRQHPQRLAPRTAQHHQALCLLCDAQAALKLSLLKPYPGRCKLQRCRT